MSKNKDVPVTEAPAGKKPPKTVYLKQFRVSERSEPGEKPRKRKVAFILHTCAVNARKEFEQKTGAEVGSCCVTAESNLTKDDLTKRDFWKERLNWETEVAPSSENESQKKYFAMKERAEKVQAAKRAAGITEWDQATEEQLVKVSELLKENSKT